MGAPTDVLIRIDEIEIELRGLSTEVHEIRALVTQSAAAPAAEHALLVNVPAPAPVEPPAPIAGVPSTAQAPEMWPPASGSASQSGTMS